STALFNVLGMVAALLRRDVDGEGQVVDTAMYECALRLTGDLLAVRSAMGIRRERAAGDSPLYPSSLTVEAVDGRFVAASAADWGEFADALGRLGRLRADDPARVKEEFTKLIGALAADEAVRVLRQAGLAASVVNSVADLVREPHLWSRGDLARRPHGDGGDLVAQGVVPLLSRTPGRLGDWSRRPGSDNEAVLSTWLGYSVERIREICSPSQPG
ncbi:MAG TPA: CoA transferase, partial [Methylomirabilota bacterium]|nr:CoA transferase [Methylomirabilota bacterium]